MEHSLLHALQLLGLLAALGGALFALLIVRPTRRDARFDPACLDAIDKGLGRLVRFSAWSAGMAGILNIFVQVAELNGETIYAGVASEAIWQYLSQTTVGKLSSARLILLLIAGGLGATSLPGKWFLSATAASGAAVCGSLVSHAAALPAARVPALAAQIAHVGSAALWLGMLGSLWQAQRILGGNQSRESFAAWRELIRRFSPFALFGVTLVVLSGLFSAYKFVQTPGSIFSSAYGLTLSLKLTLLAFALWAGHRNWRAVRPAIQRAEMPDAALTARFHRLLELELSAGILVVTLAAIVGSISPPGVDGTARLNRAQIQSVISPEFPPVRFIDPHSFVGAETRNVQDLQYSEFTHRWSGILVLLLASCWLGQSIGTERCRKVCGWIWPLLLLPFGFFVVVFADPEPWLTRNLTFREMLRSPEIIEHQLGALLVFLLAAFGLRDRKREPAMRPPGFILPGIMILGSLMLLGHAHSNLRMSEELGALINAQHAVLGGFGLLAGFVRWMQLRGIFAGAWARTAWPAGVALLGAAMAFFYTEFI